MRIRDSIMNRTHDLQVSQREINIKTNELVSHGYISGCVIWTSACVLRRICLQSVMIRRHSRIYILSNILINNCCCNYGGSVISLSIYMYIYIYTHFSPYLPFHVYFSEEKQNHRYRHGIIGT